jgi:hypothetical protein
LRAKRIGPCWNFDVLQDAEGEPIRHDQADPAPIGGGQEDGVDAGVEPDLVDAGADQRPRVAQAAEARDPGAMRQQRRVGANGPDAQQQGKQDACDGNMVRS